MSETKLSTVKEEAAKDQVEQFVAQHEESYRLLAYFAAVPLVLTPELLNFLRNSNKFLRGKIPWIAEVDLLLSNLCRPVGYEQYVMESGVRAYLLNELKAKLGEEALHEIAQLLIQYVQHLERHDPFLSKHELQTQQWAAMVYLDKHRQTVVNQIAKTMMNPKN